MNSNSRHIIAYIAARIASSRQANAIYSYETNNFYSFSGTINNANINIYDYTTSNYITGANISGTFKLFDYHTGGHIDVTVLDSRRFKGYDYNSGSYFDVTANESGSVQLYDYSAGQYFSYKL